MRKSILFFGIVFLFLAGIKVRADEGMWLPMFIERLNYVDMQKMGLHLTAEEIYSVNHSSLKDAIIIFGRGCTGEIVSDQGLVFTNHHCGYGNIQSHSTLEHDYLTQGFWALSKNEELANENLTAKFLLRMEDVTKRVLGEFYPGIPEEDREKSEERMIKRIQNEAVQGNENLQAVVKSFYEGNEYYLFVYEVYKDVRLVGTPPNSIGKFGGDTDNWMWPRHTGDFSVFRVYTAPDGKPAAYSTENIPLKPKHYLPVSVKGVNKGDFAMVMGFPGSTERYETSWGVKLAIDITNPTIVKLRDKRLSILRVDMEADKGVQIKYASKYAAISNYWKYYIGQTKGLKRLGVYEKKKTIEAAFEKWVNENPQRKEKYGQALLDISAGYSEIEKLENNRVYFTEGLLRGSEIIAFARNCETLLDMLKAEGVPKETIDGQITLIRDKAKTFFKDYNAPTDQKLLAAMLEMCARGISVEGYPAELAIIREKSKGNYTEYTAKAFASTIFAYPEKLEKFLSKPKARTLEKDPIYRCMQSFYAAYFDMMDKYDKAQARLDQGNRAFIAGLIEMQPERKFYPDANQTMRLTYGQVMDYFPADAVHYDFKTTLQGVIEKEDPGNEEFIVTDKLKQLFRSKDFGPYGTNGELVTCFTTTNDITGGNSGSPVLNGSGELIGLAFDGNWEAMSGDIAFENKIQRTICVDIRYVLFVIDKYAGAKNLIAELKINQ
ncbi:MAG: S46 family peptidase [Bacteroidetes bacterium]|nr:S46 family peptidase [Bacteroidota bacterium]